ncbi:hypothetical protein AKJ16_DCAP03497 [Drosera capensis]
MFPTLPSYTLSSSSLPSEHLSLMALSAASPLNLFQTSPGRRRGSVVASAAAAENGGAASPEDNPTRLVTFLGKGGSGKTTSAVFAAQHYAREGMKTCLVTSSQDRTADFLLNSKIGTDLVVCGNNLSAIRFETAQLLLLPLQQLIEADARINMSQGFLQGIVGEELGVLPGMDSIFSVFALEGLIGSRGPYGNVAGRNRLKDKFDVVVYDGTSPEETLRMIAAAGAARLYLKYLRNMAEKTDLGRVAGPAILRLVSEAMNTSSTSAGINGKLSSEIWDTQEKFLEKKSCTFADPEKFRCFLVMDPRSEFNQRAALRYWGCTIQAGAQVSGAFGSTPMLPSVEDVESAKKTFSPLPFALIPSLSMDSPQDWDAVMQNSFAEDTRRVLDLAEGQTSSVPLSIKYDLPKKTVTLFMPGFDKSEIKLYQYRGGSELLVAAGDQRRVIELPRQVQGKVGGAKFMDRSLVITMS